MIRKFEPSRRAVLAGLAAAAALPAMAQVPADTLAKVKAAGKLVIGNGGAFPPFEFVENGKLTGFDVELGTELAKRIGVPVEWQVIEFAGLIPALTSGRVDILLTAMTWTKERAERIAFSEPYYKTAIAAAYRPNLSIDKPEDLAGKVVGVQVGSAGERFVRDGYASAVKELRTYNELPPALRDLEIGRVEAVVNTLPVIRYNVSRREKFGLKYSAAWDQRDVGINARLGDAPIMAEINKHLAALRAEGFLDKLDEKWFGAKG